MPDQEKDTYFCQEHGIHCYKIERIEESLKDLMSKIQSSVTKEELQIYIQRIEKDIEDLKKSDRNHYRDIGLIREAISGIHKTLEASQKSQEELRQDYKQLFEVTNNIYMLLQSNMQYIMEDKIEDAEKKAEKAEEKLEKAQEKNSAKIIEDTPSKTSNPWGVLGIFVSKYGKFLVPILWFIIIITAFIIGEHRNEVLKALGLIK